MVEYSFTLDSVFGALSDSTRRDILSRVSRKAMTVGQVAEPYELTFAAISKQMDLWI
jgi:DNA-binding transcriptional ArsR family regulator